MRNCRRLGGGFSSRLARRAFRVARLLPQNSGCACLTFSSILCWLSPYVFAHSAMWAAYFGVKSAISTVGHDS